jgi:hypothetical protein
MAEGQIHLFAHLIAAGTITSSSQHPIILALNRRIPLFTAIAQYVISMMLISWHVS